MDESLAKEARPSSGLLRKSPPAQINDARIWADDVLGRTETAEILEKILLSANQPFVISLNAPYGSGKSFLLNRLYRQFLLKKRPCILVNAWETDFSGDPLTALIAEVADQLSTLGLVQANDTKREIAKRAGLYLLEPIPKPE